MSTNKSLPQMRCYIQLYLPSAIVWEDWENIPNFAKYLESFFYIYIVFA